MVKFYLIILCFVFLCLGSTKAQKIDQIAPPISAVDKQGKPFELNKQKGKVVVVDFWASWCAPCKAEMKVLNGLHTKLKDKGLKIVAVGIDREKKQFEKFLRQNPVDFTIIHDPDHKIVNLYHPPKMPSSYIIDKKGKIRFIHRGFNQSKDAPKLEKEVLELIGEK